MRKPKPFSRQGLHRLECDCGHYVYGTVAALERHGLPTCPCGEPFMPGRYELAVLLGVDDAPAAIEYRSTISGAVVGQHNGGVNMGAERQDPHGCDSVVALETKRRERARARRIDALKSAPTRPTEEALPF